MRLYAWLRATDDPPASIPCALGWAGETGEDLLPEPLKLRQIRAPVLPEQQLARRGVWAVPYTLALRSSPHAVHEVRQADSKESPPGRALLIWCCC